MRRIVSGIIVTLLLTSMLTLAFNIQSVNAWTGTVSIRADGSISPSDAPVITFDNVTYTLTDDVTARYVGISVWRNNIIINGAGHTIQGEKSMGWPGIHLGGVRNVTVEDVEIKEFYYGICLPRSSNNYIVRNNITNNLYGIFLEHSSNNNAIHRNVFINNGLVIQDSFGNFVMDNLVNGKPLVYLEGASNLTVNDAGQVILIKCKNISVENLNLSKTDIGIQLIQTNKTKITNNNITANNVNGISLWYSSNNNTISGNNITNNKAGIYLNSSLYNSIYGNNILWNKNNGIVLSNSLLNSIYRNNVLSSKGNIGLLQSSYNIIYENNLASGHTCIALSGSWNNRIYGNNITGANHYGIGLYDSSRNNIYHNNFVNGPYAKQVDSDSVNIWDSGYPSGGNYWSDYTGVDEKSGPNQNVPGSDGIGDTPYVIDAEYVIDANNRDRYPLMNPWTPTPDFSITASPTSLTIEQGGSDTSVITITSIGGFDQLVQLTVSVAPSGVLGITTTLNPEQVTPPPDGSATSTLTVLVGTVATPGSYTLTVTGTSGTLTHSVYVSLEITAVLPPEEPPTAPVYIQSRIKVLMDDGSVKTMDLDEYVKGVVAAEMGLDWPIEALKAQAVAARTFAVKNIHHDHVNVDVCANPDCCQAWKAPPYNKAIEEAVTSTSNVIILYDGEIIREALFFSHCNGHTRNSEDYPGWKYVPYLRSVACDCAGAYGWSDYYGHGVGMCQYGARVMAEQGYRYVDILKHYYTGVEIVLANTAEQWIVARLHSPGELRVYDTQDRVTGVVNAVIKEDIPNSSYDDISNAVTIFFPTDSYWYQVVGTEEGPYNLQVTSVRELETIAFVAVDIPTSASAIHQYTIDWEALSQGEEGVTVKVDSDGDGEFELILTSDNKLTQDEFMLQFPPTEAFPMWIVGVAVAAIAIATAAIAVFWRRRRQTPIKG